MARRNPEKISPVIEKLKTDNSIYVKKSGAALLRATSKRNPEFMIGLCRKWAKVGSMNTKLDNKITHKEGFVGVSDMAALGDSALLKIHGVEGVSSSETSIVV